MSQDTLAQIIKDAAYEKGWSLREVARRSDVPPATVQKIVTEPDIIPRKETLEKIAYGLSLPVTKLLEAAAAQSGYTAMRVESDEISMIVAGLQELAPERRQEILSLVQVMLRTGRS